MKALTLAALLVLSTNVMAGDILTGNELLEACTAEEWAKKLYCLGYVAGMWQGYETGTGVNCTPKGVTAGQVKDAVEAYLKANVKIRHYDASALVVRTLRETWPCEGVN